MTGRAAALRALRGLALGGYGVLLFASAPPWPDDWDGVGFLESIRTFDLERFRPHAPGYPVYVALLRVAAAVAGSPIGACALVAALGGAASAALLWSAVRRAAGEGAAWIAAACVSVAPIAWRACTVAGSEGPALACLAACAWGLAAGTGREARPARGSVVLGLGVGLGLGIRLSWAPAFASALALCPRAGRGRAWAVAAAACAAWLVPFVLVVGPARLVASYATQLAGHAGRWGGTVLTEPGVARLGWLARDLLRDGLGIEADALGVTIGALLGATAAVGAWEWIGRGAPGRRAALVLAAPYAAWIAVGQNLRDQPRHVLPLVLLAAAAAGALAARSRSGAALAAALAMAMAARAGSDARARRRFPPAGQQLVELARAQPQADRLAIFGAASVRFFEPTELAGIARAARSLGDVGLDLTRYDELPHAVWVTSELEGLASSRWPLTRVATLCRPARLDRRLPCLDVFAWRAPFLR